MEEQARFPYQFFTVAFGWSWLIWLPLVLASAGILPLGKDLLSALIPPATIVAMFGPAAGTFYCLKTLHRKDAMRQYLRGLLDFRLGWRAWLLPALVLGGSTWIAWMLPELWGEPRFDTPCASIYAVCWISVWAGGRGSFPLWCWAGALGSRGCCRSSGVSRGWKCSCPPSGFFRRMF